MSSPAAHVVRRGAGVPLVFVHGLGVDHRLLLDLDDVFAETGEWERIYLDLPGFGETRPLTGRGGLPDVADWLDQAVDGLIGSTPFAVVGNSLGGLLARDLVARRRRQCVGLALLAPVVDPLRDRRVLPEVRAVGEDHALLRSLSAEDAETYAEMAVIQSRANWERFRVAALPGIRAADGDAMRRIGELYALSATPDDTLDGFDRSTLIVAGKQDTVVGYVDQWTLSQRFARASYAVLDQAGHNVHLDQPEVVRELLRDWSRRVASELGGAPVVSPSEHLPVSS
ncbi:alpha/beta hydrolase [Spiractinospora alimapuensis]|uniref:alpha/beta fold hydrolase n=1 Tax=Spiractinospora alimapuensis TaxID=2820884 RepID=UPI001F3A1C29|nr:alpha/beta hydrolase [Spiractinospora alimapuensis]QVQ51491.1 alpha/beta hydrolase [Spiractinospora alimapuensis]